MKIRKYIVSFCALALLLGYCHAILGQRPYTTSFELTEYKGGDQSWGVAQGCDGTIYVANTKGLMWYNGLHWGLVPIQGGRVVRSIIVDDDCKIYVGGFEFFGTLDFEDPNHPRYLPMDDGQLAGSRQEVWAMHHYNKGLMLQSFSNMYQFEGDEFTAILPPQNIQLGYSNGDKLYFPTIPNGLLDYESNKFTNLISSMSFPSTLSISCVSATKDDGVVLLGTQYHGLWLQKENEKPKAWQSDLNIQLAKEQINKILITNEGVIIIGTILNGVYLLDRNLQLQYHFNKTTGLCNNTVLGLFEDRDGNIWVAMDQGITLIHFKSHAHSHYYDQVADYGTMYAYTEHEGVTYIGTNQGVYFSEKGKRFSLLAGSQGQVWSFMVAGDDLLCGHNSGTYLVNKSSWERVCDITGGWQMQLMEDGTIIQSTYTGLTKLSKVTGRWQCARIDAGNFSFETFAVSGHSLLGYHQNEGYRLLTLDVNNNSVKSHKSIANLPTNGVPYIAFDKSGFYIPSSKEVFACTKTGKISSHPLKPGSANPQPINSFYVHQLKSTVSKSLILNLHPFAGNAAGVVLAYPFGFSKLTPIDSTRYEFPQLDFLIIDQKTMKADDREGVRLNANIENITLVLKRKMPFQLHQNYQYSIGLGGKKGEWYDLSKSGDIVLLNPSHGDYEIHIRDEMHNEILLTSFSVASQWYRSWPGLILYSIVLGVGSLFWHSYNKKLHRKEREQLKKAHDDALAQERILYEKKKLEKDIIFKSKQLANSAMSLVKKNEMITDIKLIVKQDLQGPIKQKINKLIERSMDTEDEWSIFEENFNTVHEAFFKKLIDVCPEISAGELKLAGYIKMGLMSKELAPLMNISIRTVENKRYLLRLKLQLGPDESLTDFIAKL